MAGGEFDPTKFIDRDFEQSLFEELLRFQDEARLLVIQDSGGMGKSHLLRQFQYRCRTARPRIPAGLVVLDQLPFAAPLALVQSLAREFASFSLAFPQFEHYETARKAHDFTTIRGAVDLRGANLTGAQVRASGVSVEQAGTVLVSGSTFQFTPEQQTEAEKVSVRAFFEDLTAHANRQPIVLLIDAYEKCGPDLQGWLLDQLLEPFYFNPARPRHLLLALAGRSLPTFEHHWSLADCAATLKSVRALSRWGRAHVEACLRAHNLAYDPRALNLFCEMIEMGLPPSQVVQAMQTLLRPEQ